MSVVPFTTQIGPQAVTQSSQDYVKVVLVYHDKMTERQSTLMKDCQEFLCRNISILIKQSHELDTLPQKMKFFIIPSQRDELVRRIRSLFIKPIIYLPRAVIEARSYYRVNLPVRNLAISLSMYNSKIFLVRSCDVPSIRNKIYEMCGTVVTSFNENSLNVVITDRADNKYCSKAFKRGLPVVSRAWIDENYNIASEEESGFFNRDAMATIDENQIKPFYGLYFKIAVKDPGMHIKKLITDNQGRIIYGDENCLTHIVGASDYDPDSHDNTDSTVSTQKPRIVDIDFLKVCVKSGYHLTKREFRDYKANSNVVVKLEPVSQSLETRVDNYMPQTGREYNMTDEDPTMPPPSHPRIHKQQQPDNMNDMIFRALKEFDTTQTQHTSTQMRRVPDPELRIEQTYEPSQQLYWNDSVSRRN